ncbi:hypothetical protein EDD22DRAFT_961652 [Suillus occidentalis]|nr:hypothetical protein EDD22DRAFT_961652 [Suillus occidentalis]
MRVTNDNPLGIASLALECTLDEILKIREMVADKKTFQALVADAKSSYDELCDERDRLAEQKKTINPLKLFLTYRSIRLLVEAGTQLYDKTKTTSERMRRLAASVNLTHVEHVQPEDDNLSSDADVDGLVFETPDESMVASITDAASFIASHVPDLLSEGNPFADDHEAEDARVNVGTECAGSRINVAPEDSSTPNLSTDNTDGASIISSNSLLSDSSTLAGSLESSPESGNSYFSFQNNYVASGSTIQAPTLNVEQRRVA